MSVQRTAHSVRRKKTGLIFVVSGPSGSGKTTLIEQLLQKKNIRKKLARAISFTTRPKRSGEKNARDYFFVSLKSFARLQKTKELLEWTKYLGYYYATSRKFVETQLKKGKHVILCLDLKGALKIKRLYPKNTITIFVAPPSLGELYRRVRTRCQKTREEEIQKRLKLAQKELLSGRIYNYCVTNRNLAEATRQGQEILLNEIIRR